MATLVALLLWNEDRHLAPSAAATLATDLVPFKSGHLARRLRRLVLRRPRLRLVEITQNAAWGPLHRGRRPRCEMGPACRAMRGTTQRASTCACGHEGRCAAKSDAGSTRLAGVEHLLVGGCRGASCQR
jgi:hypothetical protein